MEELAAFYREAQVEFPARQVDQIDYLGLELDLMRLLCEEERSCLDQLNNETAAEFTHLQLKFLHGHLLLWAPQFCERIIQHPRAKFYRGVARLLLGFLEEEVAILSKAPTGNQELSKGALTGIGK